MVAVPASVRTTGSPRPRWYGRRAVRVAVSVVGMAVLAVLVVRALPELRRTGAVLGAARGELLLAAALLQALALAVLPQVYRSALVAVGTSARYREALPAAVGAFAISRVVPAGGVAGALFAARRLARGTLDAARVTAGVVLAGVLSMGTLGVVVGVGAAAGVADGSIAPVLGWGAGAIVVVLLGLVAVAGRVLRAPVLRARLAAALTARLGHRVDVGPWVRHADALAAAPPGRREVGTVMGWSALNWTLELGALWLALAAVGATLPLGTLVAGFGVANLLTALPHTPGGVGVVETGMAGALAALGTPPAVAVAGVVCYRLVAHWLPVLAGLPAWWGARP